MGRPDLSEIDRPGYFFLLLQLVGGNREMKQKKQIWMRPTAATGGMKDEREESKI